MGYFHKKNLKITIDRKLYWIVHFYLDLFCTPSEWCSNNQNYEIKQGEQGRVEIRMQFFLIEIEIKISLLTKSGPQESIYK